MWDTLKQWIEFFTKDEKVFYFAMLFLFIQGLFLFYLIVALMVHRKDRRELQKISIDMGVDVLFKYSWKGVLLQIRHHTDDHAKKTPPSQGKGKQPPPPDSP